MRIRKLELKDAPFMLEWMQDNSVVRDLQANFAEKTIIDCESFIETAQNDKQNIHMAVVDDAERYMGTVSLKNIFAGTAEFAITVRSAAMGKGYSKFAMDKIIEKGFDECSISSIYWCVSPDNKRAIRFYEKNGYSRVPFDLLQIKGGGTAKINYPAAIGIRSRKKIGKRPAASNYKMQFIWCKFKL